MVAPKRILAPSLALVAVALAVSGCGDSGSTVTVDPVGDAASKTAGARSFRFTLTESIRAPGVSAPLVSTARGSVDNLRRRARLSIDISHLAVEGWRVLSSPAAFRGEEVLATRVAFVRLPVIERVLPPGREWVAVDLGEPAGAHGGDGGRRSVLGPGGFLRDLTETRAPSTEVGADVVGNVDTTRYRTRVESHVAVDLSLLGHVPLALPPLRSRPGGTPLEDVDTRSRGTVPADVWVDRGGTVRRVTTSFPVRLGSGGRRARVRLKMDLFAFGASVRTTPPAASEVVDAERVAARARRGR